MAIFALMASYFKVPAEILLRLHFMGSHKAEKYEFFILIDYRFEGYGYMIPTRRIKSGTES